MEIEVPAPRIAGPAGDPSARATGPVQFAFPQPKVRFRITEALHGLEPNQEEVIIETGMGGGDCGYDFRRGFDYIVYAHKNATGALSTGICNPTRPIEGAAEALKYFRELAQAPPTAEIRVTAYDVHRSWNSGSGLAGARVTIDGPGVRKSATTSATGRYVFPDLPPGTYKIEAALEGYTTVYTQRPVQVHAKGCAEVLVPLRLDRVVSGRVFSKDGRPASGVVLQAVRTRPRRENDIPTVADSATTDADGRYELRQLATGEYYLGVSLMPPPPRLNNPYPRWFYPGTPDPGAAGIVHISNKPESLHFDLTLPDPQQSRDIQGVVLWPDGRVAEGTRIVVEDSRSPWQVGTMMVVTGKGGRFSVTVLDGTRYRLHAATVRNGQFSAEPVAIEHGSEPLDLTLVLSRNGYSPTEQSRSALEHWRKGLGLQ